MNIFTDGAPANLAAIHLASTAGTCLANLDLCHFNGLVSILSLFIYHWSAGAATMGRFPHYYACHLVFPPSCFWRFGLNKYVSTGS